MSQTTLGEALFATAARHGAARAIDDGRQRLTWAELAGRACRAGAVLRGLGLGKGDRFALWLPNSLAYVEAGLGAALIGAVVVPINTRLKPPEAEYILRKAGARVLLTADAFLDVDYVAAARMIDAPALETVLGASLDGGISDWDAMLAAVAPAEAAAVREASRMVGPDDVAEVIFTSGTTGFPKGAVIRHGQIARAYAFYAERAGIGPGDRYLIVAPMFHSFGWKAGVVVSTLAGAAMYPMAAFDADAALRLIEAERITVMGGPPTIFITLLDLARRTGRDLTSLRSIVLGGSMIPADLVRTLRQEIGVAVVLSAYGLTETTALVTMARADDTVERIATTSGQVVPGMRMRTVDPEGRPLGPGRRARFRRRGPTSCPATSGTRSGQPRPLRRTAG